MAKALGNGQAPTSPTRQSFDEICDPDPPSPSWITSTPPGGWRHRLTNATVASNVRNVAASCAMILSSFVLGIACFMLYGASWGCWPVGSCPAKCSFVMGLGIQTLILFGLSLTLFVASAHQFPISSPLPYLPAMLGGTTIVTYHWVLYGTYAKIMTRACASARLEYAFSMLLVLGHVLLGTPSLVTALVWRLGRHPVGFEEQSLCQVDDEDAAPMHERKSLLACDHEAAC